jgi:hypothetical protein
MIFRFSRPPSWFSANDTEVLSAMVPLKAHPPKHRVDTKIGTNVCSYTRFMLRRAFREKFKNYVTAAKKHRKLVIFHPRRHIFVRCDETVENFWKIFPAFTTRLLHLSENVNKTDFDGDYLANGKSYGQCLYVVQIENACVPIGRFARIWPWITMNRDTEGSNFRPSPFSRPAVDLAKI